MIKTPMDYFRQGLDDSRAGMPVTACKLAVLAWPHDAWRLGWQLGDLERELRAKPRPVPMQRVNMRYVEPYGSLVPPPVLSSNFQDEAAHYNMRKRIEACTKSVLNPPAKPLNWFQKIISKIGLTR